MFAACSFKSAKTKNRKQSKRKAKFNFLKEKTKCQFKGTQNSAVNSQ